uniref:BHLH domain-containing protein n=1 Tax=Aegilops tauschii subsp. strangulata TaxID=200361 RepID=A0A453HEL1_AEGTS
VYQTAKSSLTPYTYIRMESGGVIAEAGWDSLGLTSQAEESEMMEQLLGTFPSNGEEEHQELPWSVQATHAYYAHCNGSSNAYSSASSNSVGSLVLDVPSDYGGFYLGDSNGIGSCTAALDLNMVQEQGAAQFMDAIFNPSYGNGHSSCDDLGDSSMNLLDSIDTSNKRKRQDQGKIADQTSGRKYSRKADSKRTKKAMQCEGDDGTTADTSKQSLSCCTSEIDSNAFQEPPVASKPKGKAQAGRQTTDPQSLYARKRREKINERLKVLQNLVPNGTKVDISTMLEEAVEYVKFLQLQIKVRLFHSSVQNFIHFECMC